MAGLYFSSLNSGSNGNCYYIGNEQEAVLIDAGLSCRETEKRMRRLNLNMENVKAVFISHEHSDHIKGLELLSRNYQLPVYITPATFQQSRLRLQDSLVQPLMAESPVSIGQLVINAFPKFHDAADPHSFTVSQEETCVGVFTDIGQVCDNLISHFKKCRAAVLEANYDGEMLEKGRYPYHLKNRIRGGKGHLSNAEALELFLKHRPTYLSHLFLAHLSADNNHPDLVHQLFTERAGNTQVVVASRYKETALYQVSVSMPEIAQQLTLFEEWT